MRIKYFAYWQIKICLLNSCSSMYGDIYWKRDIYEWSYHAQNLFAYFCCCCCCCLPSFLFDIILYYFLKQTSSSVTRQKDEFQNGCFKKTEHVKFSEKRKEWVRNVHFSENLMLFAFISFWCSLWFFKTNIFVGNKAKGRISKRVFQENRACQIFGKTKGMGKECSFSRKFDLLCFLETPVLWFALLS